MKKVFSKKLQELKTKKVSTEHKSWENVCKKKSRGAKKKRRTLQKNSFMRWSANPLRHGSVANQKLWKIEPTSWKSHTIFSSLFTAKFTWYAKSFISKEFSSCSPLNNFFFQLTVISLYHLLHWLSLEKCQFKIYFISQFALFSRQNQKKITLSLKRLHRRKVPTWLRASTRWYRMK